MLEIEGPVRERGVIGLVLRGELDVASAPALERCVRAAGRPESLMLDLRGLEFVDSTGIAALLRLEREARDAGGRLSCLVGPGGAVRQVLDMTLIGDRLGMREAPPWEGGPPR